MIHEVAHPLQDAQAIERELRRLWREASSEAHPVMRARVMSLLVATDAAHETEVAESLSGLMTRHPARTILLLLDEAESVEFDALATIFCLNGEHPLCMEQVRLHASLGTVERLVSAVRLLLDPSLPSALWWGLPPLQHPPARDALTALVERQVIDSRMGCERALFQQSPSASVDDLAWEQLHPWRELVAGLFDPAERVPHLSELERVLVEQGGCPVEGWLLVGWLASRLGWRLSKQATDEWTFERPDGEQGTVEFSTTEGGEGLLHLRLETAAQHYEVVRDRNHATCGVASGKEHEQRVLPFHDRSPMTLFSRTMDRLRPDPLYRESRAALRPIFA